MHTLPEYAQIIAFLASFVVVFLVSNIVARAVGYKE